MKAIYAVPATLAIVYRAHSHNSLTPAGIFAGVLTAAVHAYHPWNLPFVLLCVFFLAGSRVTKVKQDVKAHLTMHSRGSSGGEGPRTHIQVFANSLIASVLTLLHAHQLKQRSLVLASVETPNPSGTLCFSWPGDLLVVGIIANYAAVTADTFSSELGILSRSSPRLITSLTLRRVPPGTNGGVTLLGLGAALLGSMIIVTAATVTLPLCLGDEWTTANRTKFMWAMTLWGAVGSLLDSFLGGLLQRTVRDSRTGKVVEGEGGVRVLISPEERSASGGLKTELVGSRVTDFRARVLHGEGTHAVPDAADSSAVDDTTDDTHKYDPHDKHRKPSFGDRRPTRVVESGWDLLDNNDVNFLMAFVMSIGAMVGASWYWGVPMENILMP